jgi:hypothetical protein
MSVWNVESFSTVSDGASTVTVCDAFATCSATGTLTGTPEFTCTTFVND